MEDKHITLPSKESVIKVLLDRSKQILKKAGIKDGPQTKEDTSGKAE